MSVLILKTQMRNLLRQNGKTVTSLARSTQIPVQTLHNWLSGQKPKDIEQVKKVASYFSVSLDEFCFGKQNDISNYFNPVEKASPLKEILENEIYAGKFEVILRKIN